MSSVSAFTALATSIGTIWTSAAIAKMYYTKRMADAVEKHGWPPAGENNDKVAASGTIQWAAWGTLCAGIGFWLLKD